MLRRGRSSPNAGLPAFTRRWARKELARSAGEKVQVNRPKETSLLAEFSRDLTQAALEGQLDPLVGTRPRKSRRVIQILCRAPKIIPCSSVSPALARPAIVEGLAQRIFR